MKTIKNTFFTASINPDKSYSIEYSGLGGSTWLLGFVSEGGLFFIDPCGEQVQISEDHIPSMLDIVKKVHAIQRVK